MNGGTEELAALSSPSGPLKARLKLSFEHLGHSVLRRKGAGPLEILSDVTGECKPGRLCAIMGPSGAGKTTLLNILANNLTKDGKTTGKVRVNGQSRSTASFRAMSCYVMQEDVLLSSATVREAVMTSAQLRLPYRMSLSEKRRRVDAILGSLGLEGCADTLIGDATIGLKGISGGEKKRLSIGIELVTDPKVMFLDEPTSGLDSEVALTVMTRLRDLAAEGRTVICTIHQPNSDIVESFDDLLLLSKGRLVYLGPFDIARDFFSEHEYPCPQFKNPTDHFMNVISREGVGASLADAFASWRKVNLALSAHGSKGLISNGEEEPARAAAADVEALGDVEASGGASPLGTSASPVAPVTLAQTPGGRSMSLEAPPEAFPKARGVPFLYQVWVLSLRFYRTWWRNPLMFVSELSQYMIIGVFTGLMYLQIGKSVENGQYEREASQWFILVVAGFTPSFTACTAWEKERPLLRQELVTGSYRLSSFFLAKTGVMVPFEVFLGLLYCIVTYFMIGYQLDFLKWIQYTIVFILTLLISESMGSASALATRDVTVGVVVLSLVLIVLLSFTGFLVPSTPVYFQWIEHVSFLNYAASALIQTELKDLVLTESDGTEVAVDVQEALDGSVLDNGLGVWGNICVLVGMAVGLKAFSFLGLWYKVRMGWL